MDLTDPRHHTLVRLVTDSNKTLTDAGYPLCPVEPPWLHITLDQVTGRAADHVSEEERHALAAALERRLAHVPPLDIMVGSLLTYHSGVVADLHPDEHLAHLHAAVRETISSICGPAATDYPWGIPHLTVAYAYGTADSDAAQRLLRRVRPGHAPLHIRAVHLVDVTATTSGTTKTITWERVATIPLGGKGPPSE
ncbi:2'-5' RNA ligase family protein [Streptomyces sp. BR1]|uniref:2'-5' RNA ligase family protein n=1 Tax=Streptomyces sp. BR1 TaxID=1592323 RepID=UPI00402B3D64